MYNQHNNVSIISRSESLSDAIPSFYDPDYLITPQVLDHWGVLPEELTHAFYQPKCFDHYDLRPRLPIRKSELRYCRGRDLPMGYGISIEERLGWKGFAFVEIPILMFSGYLGLP